MWMEIMDELHFWTIVKKWTSKCCQIVCRRAKIVLDELYFRIISIMDNKMLSNYCYLTSIFYFIFRTRSCDFGLKRMGSAGESTTAVSTALELSGSVNSNAKYHLRWQDYPHSVVTSFRHLKEDEDFVDVTLACNSQQFTAHKVVLSACSPYFKKLLKVRNWWKSEEWKKRRWSFYLDKTLDYLMRWRIAKLQVAKEEARETLLLLFLF